jgi:predicted 3-demethylubiquinone-9 3-methyltransferase (glyoxalase superfamily)
MPEGAATSADVPQRPLGSTRRIMDKYGVRWQIVPTVLGDMITDPDRAKAKRVTEAMLKQVKIDIAKLEAAYRGN